MSLVLWVSSWLFCFRITSFNLILTNEFFPRNSSHPTQLHTWYDVDHHHHTYYIRMNKKRSSQENERWLLFDRNKRMNGVLDSLDLLFRIVFDNCVNPTINTFWCHKRGKRENIVYVPPILFFVVFGYSELLLFDRTPSN